MKHYKEVDKVLDKLGIKGKEDRKFMHDFIYLCLCEFQDNLKEKK